MTDSHPQENWLVNNFSMTLPASSVADLLRKTADTVQNELRLDYILNWIFLFDPKRTEVTSTVYFDWDRCGFRTEFVLPGEVDLGEMEDALAPFVLDVKKRVKEAKKLRTQAPWLISSEITITIFENDSVSAVLSAANILDIVGCVPTRICFLTDPASIAETDGPLALSISW